MPGRRLRRQQRQRLRALRRTTAILLGDDARLAAQADAVAAALRAANPIDEVLYLWEMERVTTLAVHRARELGVEHDAWSARAEERRREAEMRATFDDLALAQLIRELAAHEIPALALKGAPMATRLYGSPGLRSRSADIDLLVAPEHLFLARDVLVERGWDPPTDPLLDDGLPQHHLSLPGSGPRPSVELHWRVQWYDDAAHARGIIERAVEHAGIPVPAPVDVLDILLQCWARDGLHGLRLGADIAAWWRAFGSPEDSQLAYAAPRTGRAASISAQAAAALFGTPEPRVPLDDWAARLAVGVAVHEDPPEPEERELSQRALVDLLAGPRDQRSKRFRTTWLLDRRMSSHAHPWAPRPIVPALRTASAIRTAIDVAPVIRRARRSGSRSPR